MILRERPSAWRLFFLWRGSIVSKILPQIIATMSFAGLVVYSHGTLLNKGVTFTPTPFTILGLALSIFLGFRNAAAYDRYWEARLRPLRRPFRRLWKLPRLGDRNFPARPEQACQLRNTRTRRRHLDTGRIERCRA
jgi:hypothetical protein